MQHPLIITACEIWQIQPLELLPRTRKPPIPTMRQILAKLLREKTGVTLKAIAKQLGYKDHADVIHACQQCTDYLKNKDEKTLKYYEPIKHLFYE